MTTERSGRSDRDMLLKVQRWILDHVEAGTHGATRICMDIDAHLSRDAGVSDFPMGAIENGRVFADRVENTDLSCIAGDLHLCVDWHEFRRCFEYLANWALTESFAARPAAVPAGYVLVPVEPTEAMILAGVRVWDSSPADNEQIECCAATWRAMLAQRDGGGNHGT